ncbi:hypothetical protein B0H67DRAFT_133339 [Lasiosphaeris hirsuta]|uniref:DUF6594 domain-containing protein n=1 Tax=Lasiosphaeris hirsuta TaxID=260670 RepID=A0AA40B0P0_9PEZI|nr:hypothetical protein B0H67DRAFT_133339 [Lasiosphaeris hirsuta]
MSTPQLRHTARMEHDADLAGESWMLRKAAGAKAPVDEDEEDSSSGSSSGSDTAMPAKQPVDERRRPGRYPGRQQNERRHNSLDPKETQRPTTSSNRRSAPDRIAPSHFKSTPPAVHKDSPSRQPTAVTVVDGGEEDSAGAVDSESDEDLPEPLSTRLRSATLQHERRAEASAPRERSATTSYEHVDRRQTVTRSSPKQSEDEKHTKNRRPDPLSFLEPGSAEVTAERIQRALAEASGEWSPSSAASSSSNDSGSQRSIAETDATTPEQSVNGDAMPALPTDSPSPLPEHKYGTPEMARGPVKHPHIPPKELQPRVSAPGQGHPKHLPRAEKLPMSGYQLLSAKLSNSATLRSRRHSSSRMAHENGEQAIKPIYRRFETLNHRLLLHMQDELTELEEQLHRLDTADTQTRRLSNCILPASRRAEFMSGGELQWHKTDILGKIGFKLGQYSTTIIRSLLSREPTNIAADHVLASFTETQTLTPASLGDIEAYRTYLATQNPIAEIETRFLDPTEDLVCLAPNRSPTSSFSSSSPRSASPSAMSDDLLTPMPRKMTLGFTPSPSATAASSRKGSIASYESRSTESQQHRETPQPAHPKPAPSEPEAHAGPAPGIGADLDFLRTPLGQVASLAAVAVVLPVCAFPLVGDFVGRMAVVLVAGLAVAALRERLADAGVWIGVGAGQVLRPGDVMVIVGVYVGVMGVVAVLL